MTFGDGSSRFDLTDTPHYHMICDQCGSITDFTYSEVSDIIEEIRYYK